MKTKLILIRHGESEANVKNVIAGHHDVSLSKIGLDQAEQTAEHLANERIDAIYSSDLRRAFETALPNAARHGLSVIRVPELRELYCGRWEGKSREYLEVQDHDAYVNGFRLHYFGFTMPEGESEAHCRARICAALQRIAEENAGKTVLIVSHGAALRSFWAAICGYTDDEANERVDYPSNASYSVVEFDGERFTPVEYSHDSHLTNVTHVHI